jgi:hypothetical protein
MGWFEDFTDNVLGIDESKGTFLGIGGTVGEIGSDIVGKFTDVTDWIDDQVEDAVDFVQDDLGIDLQTVAAIGLAFVPGMQAFAGNMLAGTLGAVPGLSSAGTIVGGLTTAAGQGIVQGAQIGLGVGTAQQGISAARGGEFDIEAIGEAGIRGAAAGGISAAAVQGATMGVNALARETSQGLRSIGLDSAADSVYNVSASGGPMAPSYLTEGARYGQKAAAGITGQVAATGEFDVMGALTGIVNPYSGVLGGVTSGLSSSMMTQGQQGGQGAAAGGAGYGISSGTQAGTGQPSRSNNQGTSQPTAQFIDTGTGSFGSPGAGGVFGGLDQLGSSDAFVDVGQVSDIYAQREVGAMVTAGS